MQDLNHEVNQNVLVRNKFCQPDMNGPAKDGEKKEPENPVTQKAFQKSF